MFGPSGERNGSILEYCDALMSRIEKEARSRVTPPLPMTDKRRRLSISAKGFVWSRIVDKRLRRKKSLIVAISGFFRRNRLSTILDQTNPDRKSKRL